MIGYIYSITNKINGKQYIGQTVNYERRVIDHKYYSKKEIKYRSAIYDAMKKYGVDNFEFTIIETCDAEELDVKEQEWIAKLNTLVPNGYNILNGGKKLFDENNPFYGKFHTEETKNKISKKNKNRIQSEEEIELRKIINSGENNPFYGKHHTEETKKLIAQKQRENGVYERHSLRMKENNPNKDGLVNNKSVFMYDLNGNFIKTFKSVKEAGRYCIEKGYTTAKNPDNTIRDCCKLRIKTAYGFIWKYS